MGASLVYLDSPKTDVEFESGQNARIRYAVGEMQGWRLNMVSGNSYSNSRTQPGILFSTII